MQILLQLMVLEQLHHPQAVDFHFGIQRDKLKLFGVLCHVLEGTLDGVQVVSADRRVFAGSAESVMQLLLGSNEGLVCFLVEVDVSEDSCSHEGSNLFDLDSWSGTDGSMVMEVVGAARTTSGVLISSRYILKARTRVASVSRSGLLFMQSNLKNSLTTLPSLSFSRSSSI